MAVTIERNFFHHTIDRLKFGTAHAGLILGNTVFGSAQTMPSAAELARIGIPTVASLLFLEACAPSPEARAAANLPVARHLEEIIGITPVMDASEIKQIVSFYAEDPNLSLFLQKLPIENGNYVLGNFQRYDNPNSVQLSIRGNTKTFPGELEANARLLRQPAYPPELPGRVIKKELQTSDGKGKIILRFSDESKQNIDKTLTDEDLRQIVSEYQKSLDLPVELVLNYTGLTAPVSLGNFRDENGIINPYEIAGGNAMTYLDHDSKGKLTKAIVILNMESIHGTGILLGNDLKQSLIYTLTNEAATVWIGKMTPEHMTTYIAVLAAYDYPLAEKLFGSNLLTSLTKLADIMVQIGKMN